MEKFCRMPPTALSLLSPPSIVTFTFLPVEPPTENVPTRALVGSNEGCSVAPGMRIASEAKDRPLTGKFLEPSLIDHAADIGLSCLNEGSCVSGDVNGFTDRANFQFGVDGGAL